MSDQRDPMQKLQHCYAVAKHHEGNRQYHEARAWYRLAADAALSVAGQCVREMDYCVFREIDERKDGQQG